MLTSLTTAEAQIATTVRYHFTSIRMAVRNQNTASVGKVAEKLDLVLCPRG